MPHSDTPGGEQPSRRYTFPRSHRLKRRNLIRSLFDRSREDVETIASGTIRLLFRLVDRRETGHDVPVQVGFAPGGRTTGAVQRNRIRRKLRESYRQHQHPLRDVLAQYPEQCLICMILFRSDPSSRQDAISRDVALALDKLAHQLSNRPAHP